MVPQMDQQMPPQTPQQPQSPTEQWFQQIAGLQKDAQKFDVPANHVISDLGKKTDALQANRGLLRDDEMAAAVKQLQSSATSFPWEHHIKQPGSTPGDVIEQEGIRKLRQPDGSLMPIGYTAQFIQQNIVPLGDSGQLAIPVSPTEPYRIVAAKKRDMAQEREDISAAVVGIRGIKQTLMKSAMDRGTAMNPETILEISDTASREYVKQQLQAKSAAKHIADGGASVLNQAIGGKPSDPVKAEKKLFGATKRVRQAQATKTQADQQHAEIKEMGARQRARPPLTSLGEMAHAALNPAGQLQDGQAPDDLPVGQAVRDAQGSTYIRAGDDQFLGPYSQEEVDQFRGDVEQSPE